MPTNTNSNGYSSSFTFTTTATTSPIGIGVSEIERTGNTVSAKLSFAESVRGGALAVAFCAALISAFFVYPDKAYLNYFDYKTLSCLFMTLAVVCALRNIMFFTILSRKIVKMAGNLRLLAIYLVIITFVGSMLIANDMALITFLPLSYMALDVTKNDKYAAYIFILQNISANLGGMILPFGNPQNLYLYTKFEIPTGEFMGIMAFPFVLSVALITAICLIFVKSEPMRVDELNFRLNKRKAGIYLLLFALSIIIVFRVIPYRVGLAVILSNALFGELLDSGQALGGIRSLSFEVGEGFPALLKAVSGRYFRVILPGLLTVHPVLTVFTVECHKYHISFLTKKYL